MGDSDTQNLIDTTWAFSATVLERCVGDFSPQALANTAWALATVRMPDVRLFTALAIAAERRVGSFNP